MRLRFRRQALAQRSDLPDFDYIGVHGIWSWVSDENRRVMVDFVRRKLKVGGVLYIGYNSLPGWAAFAPMRHLLNEHVEVLCSKDGGVIDRVDGALDFASRLMATQPLYAVANPQVEGRIVQLKVKSLARIEEDVRSAGIGLLQVVQALLLLCGSGHVVQAQDEAQIDAAKPRTDKLNRHLMSKARGNGDINYLASPVSGGGVNVNRFQQLFLLAIEQNGRTPEDLARFAWPFLAAQGLSLLKDGRLLGTVEENLAELGAQAGEFMEKRLPILRALGIA